jgi:hypothetical protein
MSGTLCLRPLAAQLTRDVSFLGKMDPYCEFIVGKNKVKGLVCQNGGVNPIWEDDRPLIINITTEPTMTVNLKEKKLIGSDVIVGTCEVNLYDVRLKKNYVKWVPLAYQNTHAGKILFEAVFQPDQSGHHVNQPITHQAPFMPFNPIQNQPMQHRMSQSNYPFQQGIASAPVGREQINQNWEYVQPNNPHNTHTHNLNQSVGQNLYAPASGEQNQPLVLQHSYSEPNKYTQPQNSINPEPLYAPPSTSNTNTNVELNFSQKYPSLEQQVYQPYQPYAPTSNVNQSTVPKDEAKKENQSFFGKLKSVMT